MARNPAKVVHAFTAGVECVAGVALREVTASTMNILQRLNSPIVRPQKPGVRPELSNEDVIRLLFVLSHPAIACYDLLQRNAFDAAAIEFADTVKVADLPAVGAAINRLFERAFSTVLAPEKKTAATTTSLTVCPAGPATAGS